MPDGLHWVAERPARHFREAANMVLIYIQEIFLDGVGDISSCGRFDQYLWPFLKSDLETSYCTMEEAQEIVDCFFLKINGFYGGGEGELAKIVGIGNTYMHTTVGGVDPKTGEDATNPITYMVLGAVGCMKLHDPTISLRVNKNTPRRAVGHRDPREQDGRRTSSSFPSSSRTTLSAGRRTSCRNSWTTLSAAG